MLDIDPIYIPVQGLVSYLNYVRSRARAAPWGICIVLNLLFRVFMTLHHGWTADSHQSVSDTNVRIDSATILIGRFVVMELYCPVYCFYIYCTVPKQKHTRH